MEKEQTELFAAEHYALRRGTCMDAGTLGGLRWLMIPRFENGDVEKEYRSRSAEGSVRYAFAVWIFFSAVYGISSVLVTVFEFLNINSTPFVPGEPVHVLVLTLHLVLMALFIHGAISSWASRQHFSRDVRGTVPQRLDREEDFWSWLSSSSSTSAAEAYASFGDAVAAAADDYPVFLNSRHYEKPTIIDYVATARNPSSLTRMFRCIKSMTGWWPNSSHSPLSSERESLVIMLIVTFVFKITVVLEEFGYHGCREFNTANECGLTPQNTDAPTLLYSPFPLFTDIYLASSVVLFQMPVSYSAIYLGLYSLWLVCWSTALTAIGVFDVVGTIWFLLLRLMLYGLLFYAVRTNDMALRRAFVWAKLRVASTNLIRQRTQFLARVSHEVQTPIHVMMMGIELLNDTVLTEDQRAIVEMSRGAADRVFSLMRDTIDLAALDACGIVLNEQLVLLEELIDVAPLLPLARTAGLLLRVSASSDCPPAIMADRARVSQVVWNLVTNAIKYTESGSVTVHVELGPINGPVTSGPPEAVIISVFDTGPGIPQELDETIYQPFARAVPGDAAIRIGGVGLGLALVKELAQLWQGKVGHYNRPRFRGACFWFTIPLRVSVDTLATDPEKATKSTASVGERSADSVESVVECNNVDIHDGTVDARTMMERNLDRSGLTGIDRGLSEDANMIETQLRREHRAKREDAGDIRVVAATLSRERTAHSVSQSPGLTPARDDAILIADDNSSNRKMLELYLSRLTNARILTAVDGQDAASRWFSERTNIRLCLIDHHMPNVDGVEAVARIRKVEEELGRRPAPLTETTFPTPSLSIWRDLTDTTVPILCITASTSSVDVAGQYRSAKFDGLVTKPFHRETVVAALHVFCPDLLSEQRSPALRAVNHL